MAVRNDISQALDILSKKPGSIMYRGPDIWEGSKPPVGSLNALFATIDGKVEWRPIAAFAGIYRTKAVLTANRTFTSNGFLNWDAVEFDEAGLWSPSDPQNFIAPAAGLIRADFTTAETATRGGNTTIGFVQGDPSAWYARTQVVNGTSAQGALPWISVVQGQVITPRSSQSAGQTALAEQTYVTLEFQPSP